MTESQLNIDLLEKAYKAGKKIVSNYRVFVSDVDTPVSLYNKLNKYYEDCFLFESVLGGENLGRYSFIGSAALHSYKSYHSENKDPYTDLKNIVSNYSNNGCEDLSANLDFFHQGLVGFFGFESMQRIEPCLKLQSSRLPESFFYVVGNLIVFDHVSQKLYLINNICLRDCSEKDLKRK